MDSKKQADSKQSGNAKSNPTPAKSSANTGPKSPTLVTLQKWIGKKSKPQMSSAVASPVKTSQQQAKARALQANALACGKNSLELLRQPGQLGLSQKTSQHSLQEDWQSYWKTSGSRAIRRSGLYLLKLPQLAHSTKENESSSWPTPTVADTFTGTLNSTQQKEDNRHSLGQSKAVQRWPTPRAQERKQQNSQNNGMALSKAVTLFPTPCAQDAKNSTFPKSQLNRDSIPGAIMRTFPTPIAGDWKGQIRKDGTASMLSGIIEMEAKKKMFPTPNCPRPHDSEASAGRALPGQKQKDLQQVVALNGEQLNPDWVELLMGFPKGYTSVPLGKKTGKKIRQGPQKESKTGFNASPALETP